MKPIILAFTGIMGAGKSEAIRTLAAFLMEQRSTAPIVLIKFAQPLYDMQESIYSRIESVYQRPQNFIKDRFLLQYLGTEWGRNTIDQDIWVKLWITAVNEAAAKNPGAIIVCDDCRFDNEAEVVKIVGGKIIKITTDRNNERIDVSRSNHASEQGVSTKYLDFIIENNGTMYDYKNKLTYLFNTIGLK